MHCSFLPSENFLGKKVNVLGMRGFCFLFFLQQFIEFTQEPPLGIKSRLHLVSSTFSGHNQQLVSSPPFFSPSHQSNMHANMYLYIFSPLNQREFLSIQRPFHFHVREVPLSLTSLGPHFISDLYSCVFNLFLSLEILSHEHLN